MVRVSPLDNEPCKQCTSFADYLKENKKKFAQDRDANEDDEGVCLPEEKPRRADCPLDKDELGHKSWGLLHTIAAKYPDKPSPEDRNDMNQFLNLFAKFYPCLHCAKDLQEDLKKDPPNVTSHDAFSQWMCQLHNKVNVKLGKPLFDCSRVNERWRDGWKDGSCDW